MGWSLPFPTLGKKGLPSIAQQRQQPAQCIGRAFFMQMNTANCACRLSNRDNPSQGTTFLVLLLGGGIFAQLPPPCPEVYGVSQY